MHWQHYSAGGDQGSYFQLDKGAKAELRFGWLFWFRNTNNKMRRGFLKLGKNLATNWSMNYHKIMTAAEIHNRALFLSIQFNIQKYFVINLYL